MKTLSKIIFSFISNILGIFAASYLIPGFIISPDYRNIITLAGTLTIINILLRPFLKLILSPFIIITLGLFTIIINAGILLTLDFLFESLTINGIPALIYSTLVISGINLIIGFLAKRLFKKR